MKKLTWILIVVFAASLLIWGFAISQEKPKTSTLVDTAKKEVTKPTKADTVKKVKEHAYVGVSKCKGCHNMKKWGKIYDKWAATKHATAYATLANKESKAIAKKMNIKDAQKSERCLICHVTGYTSPAVAKIFEKGEIAKIFEKGEIAKIYGKEGPPKGKKYSMEEGVTCETCHGPAGDYVTSHIKKDNKKQAMADGLIIPTEELSKELCVRCHNKQSPTYKEFKYKEAVKLVEHHKPTAEELKKLEESEKEKSEGK
jgi:hypothetical protein